MRVPRPFGACAANRSLTLCGMRPPAPVADRPPSTTKTCPVMKLPAFDARSSSGPASSAGSPTRPCGAASLTQRWIVRDTENRTGHLARKPARRDGVDANAAVGPASRKIARQVDHGRLRGLISGRKVGDTHHTGDRCDVDDRATLAVGELAGSYRLTAVPRPQYVHAHRLLEELVRNALGHDRRFGRDAGVVDQDVDAAEMLPTGSDHRRDVIRVADVALQGECLVAGRSQPVGYRLHLVERARREHEVGARARQGFRKRDTEPVRRAGHQRCLALQREQRVSGHGSQGKGNGGAAFGRVATGGGGAAVRHSVGFHLLPFASRLKCVLVRNGSFK